MRRYSIFISALILGTCWGGPAPGASVVEGGGRDLASEVRSVLAARCAACHGPEVRKPKGRFGHVLDLARLASDPDLVVPFRPDESRLWQLVSAGRMPPRRAGPLTTEEKDTLRAWIESGAGYPETAGAPVPASPASPDASPGPALTRALHWLGRFHVVVVHFPIALLLAGLAGELWAVWRRSRVPSPAVRFCVLLGAASAVPAATLGWLHAWGGYGAGAPEVLALHRWTGTAAAVGAVVLAALSEADASRGVRSVWFRVLLLLVALLVGAAGHFGGTLVHGEAFFTG
jgi:uncharacterized membrane protein